jgi:hypothetical protein
VIRSTFHGLQEAFERAQPASDAAIVYPSPDAVDLETLPASERPSEIVVLDGTWHHAKTLLREIPALNSLRRVRFTPKKPSEYLIRKEPKEEYLSTIESVAHLLRVLEPDTAGIEGLIDCFRAMIELNVVARGKGGTSGRFRKREAGTSHHFPEGLAVPLSDAVVIYGEGTSRLKNELGLQSDKKEPLIFVAERLDGSERWEFILKTDSRPPPRLLQHLGLSESDHDRRAVSLDSVRRHLEERLRPEDLVVAWNASSLAMLREMGVHCEEHLLLKGAYCNFAKFLDRLQKGVKGSAVGQHGDMEMILTRHGIESEPARARGRAYLRLKQTSSIFRWLSARKREFEGEEEH